MSNQLKYLHTHSPAARGAMAVVAVVDVALRAWALADLVNRPQREVKGSKTGWAIGLAVVNSVGLLPATYLLWARQTD